MDLEQAIKTALEYENKVYQTYAEAQEKATDAIGQRVFKVMAKEEMGHIKYLECCLEQWLEKGTLQPELMDTAIPEVKKIQAAADGLKQSLNEKGIVGATEIELLQRALKLEVETSNFYAKMVSEMEDEGKRLFQRFLEIEEGHQAIVQAEIDSVTGLGFWFDMPEFQLEAE